MSFENATYYGERNDELLSAHDPVEAIERVLDRAWEKGESMKDTAKRLAPIEIVAYERDEILPRDIDDWALWLFDLLEEHVGDEYGDPDGNHDPWTEEEKSIIKRCLRGAVQMAADLATVWRCSPAGSRDYDEAALLEIVEKEGWD